MSEYNDFFDLDGPQLPFQAVDSEYPALTPDLDQSTAWTPPLQPPAQLQLDVDSAPSVGVEPLGLPHLQLKGSNHACAICLEPYQTDSALHQHAIQAQHQAYQCKCGTGFTKNSALQRHINTKDAPKTFACPLCDQKFTRKDKVKDHCHHFHKVTDKHLRLLLSSQETKPRVAAPSSRRRAPRRKPTVSSGPPAPVSPPAHAPAITGPADWSFTASTGQQYTTLPADPLVSSEPLATTSPSIPASSSATAGQFVPSTNAFAAAPGLCEDFFGPIDDFSADNTWATDFDGFSF